MKKILLLFITIVLLYGCKKYPDGPAISLLSKESRITGEWDVEYFSVNGYDSTEYLKSKLAKTKHMEEIYLFMKTPIQLYQISMAMVIGCS